MKSTKSETKRSSRQTRKTEESPPRTTIPMTPTKYYKLKQSPEKLPKTPTKSPSRKSPGRKSPSRKSPGRKSPARKSPSRVNVKTEPTVSVESKSPVAVKPFSVRPETIKFETKQDKTNIIHSNININNGLQNFKNIQPRVLRERKPRLAEFEISRRVTRQKGNEEFEKLLHLAQNTELPKNSPFQLENDLSEDDSIPLILPPIRRLETPVRRLETPVRRLETPVRKLETPVKEIKSPNFYFGGPWCVPFLIILGPLLIIVTNMACNEQICSFTEIPDFSQFKILHNLFTLPALYLISSYIFILMLTLSVPYFGKRVKIQNHEHTSNIIFSLFLIIFLGILVENYFTSITNIIYRDFIPLQIISGVFGAILAIILFIKGGRISKHLRNQNAISGYKMYDLWMGREIYPRIGKINMKYFLFRYALCGMVLVNLVWLYKGLKIFEIPTLSLSSFLDTNSLYNLSNAIHINSTLAFLTITEIIYIFNFLRYEAYQDATFEFRFEGVGWSFSVGYTLYPFFLTMITKNILDNNIELSNYLLITSCIIFIIGFYICHRSNYEKYIFRKNPLDPKIAHLQTLPTFQGKKLLISGWWGFVRHPNYLGDLLMHISWAICMYDKLPIYVTFVTFAYLLHRLKQDTERCSEYYGVAWKRYCQKVPYALLPKIY